MIGVFFGAAFLLWWLSLRPSNSGDWLPEYAEMPWAEINGDEVTIHNFRNCEYRSATDMTARWETRTVHLSKLCGIDFFLNYWSSLHIGHTLLSFDFGDEGYVCVSIEARRERGQHYSPFLGLLRQYPLYYVIGDERDLIRVRTNIREQNVYLYRLGAMSTETYRALFLSYLRSANELRTRPRWYHAALDNCTTNMRKNTTAGGFAIAWDWRILFNGHIDELLHQRGIIPSSQSFTETKVRAWINERARETGTETDFSRRIRSLPA